MSILSDKQWTLSSDSVLFLRRMITNGGKKQISYIILRQVIMWKESNKLIY